MSRLYDALTEANRARQGLDPGNRSDRRETGIPDIEIPPLQTVGEPVVASPDTASIEDINAAVALEIAPSAPESPKNGLHGDLGAPTIAGLDRQARLIPHAIDGAVVEHYRRLRTKILQKREDKPFQTLLVTSANPQEGKTVTALNLGLSFAMLPGFKVLVVDGDLRRGSLGNWLGVPPGQAGLSDLVAGSATLEDVVLQSEAIPMHFMVRGNCRITDVHAAQFGIHFRKLAESFDLVIVDSPPVNLLADVQLLASCCDAVLLVARSFVTSKQALEKAVQDLEHFNVIGTVLNATTKRARDYYGYYRGQA